MTITLGDGPTHPTPSRPKPGPPPPDPPRRPVNPPPRVVERGEYIAHLGQRWRVDAVHLCHSTCSRCRRVHDAYTLGRPGRWLTHVPECEVAP